MILVSDTEYKKYIEAHHKAIINLTDLQEKQLARLYLQAAADIKARAKDIISNKTLTAAQAKIRINSLLREAARLSDNFTTMLDKALIQSADLGKEVNKIVMSQYQRSLAKEGVKLNLTRMLSKVSQDAVKSIYNRIWTDGLKLSDRIWLLKKRTKQEIERIVMQHIISGGSASDKVTLSALENLLSPTHPGKLTSLHGRRVFLEGSRLLRTSAMEAYNEADRMSSEKNPGSKGQQWLTADGCCDLCDAKNGRDVKDVGYPPEHPNCRCSTIDVVEDITTFTDRYIEFMNNPASQPDLVKWYNEIYKAA